MNEIKPYFIGVDYYAPIKEEEPDIIWVNNKPWCLNDRKMTGLIIKIGDTYREFPCEEFQILNPEEVREEVWEFVETITDMSHHDMKECFDCDIDFDVFNNYTYKEAEELYEKWVATKVAIKEITLEQIEGKLGCKIKIVSKEAE